MPDLKISQLPVATTPLAGTELVPIVQGGVTDQTTVQAIMTSTVPSGTANGVLYLDGSKVATSGSALTFDGTNFGVGTSNFEMYDTNAGSNVSTFYRLKYTGGDGQTNVGTAFSNDSGGSALGFWRNNSAAKPVRGAAISADWASITAGSESASLIFSTQSGGSAASEQMRLTSGGAFLVGTTASPSGLNKNGVEISNGSSIGRINIGKSVTGSQYATVYYYNGNAVGNISYTDTATAYNTSSDYRLKDNPQPLTNSGAFIDALQPKTWEWKADGSRGVGFIAHEVQAVSPSSVVGEKDAVDVDGKPVMQAMEYGSAEFIANIIAELKALRARVAALEAQP